MEWHGYFLITADAALTQGEVDTAEAVMSQVGQHWDDFPDENPSRITQIRKSVDGYSIIAEVLLDHVASRDNAITYLALAWGVSEAVADRPFGGSPAGAGAGGDFAEGEVNLERPNSSWH